MAVAHLLAVVPVTDLEAAAAWYERLSGRAPDNRPMPTLAEWRVTDTGWVQVHVDADRAGRALLNLAVDDLAAHLDQLRSRGLSPAEVQTASKGVQLASATDPDGNVVTLIGGFRVVY